MGDLGLIRIASGCGMTDFLVTESVRDFCDSWIVCTGILVILLMIYLGKNYRLKSTGLKRLQQ